MANIICQFSFSIVFQTKIDQRFSTCEMLKYFSLNFSPKKIKWWRRYFPNIGFALHFCLAETNWQCRKKKQKNNTHTQQEKKKHLSFQNFLTAPI